MISLLHVGHPIESLSQALSKRISVLQSQVSAETLPVLSRSIFGALRCDLIKDNFTEYRNDNEYKAFLKKVEIYSMEFEMQKS